MSLARTLTVPLLLLALVGGAFLLSGRASTLLVQGWDATHGKPPLPPVPLACKVVALKEAASQESDGSGFCIGPGRVATCAHVVQGQGLTPMAVVWPVEGHPEGRTAAITGIERLDAGNDLAVLTVAGDAGPPMELSARTPDAGERVWVLSRPAGMTPATVIGPVTIGGVTGFDLKADGLGPGSSGGAVVDSTGKVVGVVEGEGDTGAVLVVGVGPLMRYN
jgi:S1-C subfamily serine protease